MEWGLVALVFVIIVMTALSKLNIEGSADTTRYDKQTHLFTPAERSFFGVLNKSVQDQAIVLGKVRVADVLKPKKGMNRSDWQKAFNRISSKHVDFVLCKPNDLSILAVVELDDKSHNNAQRVKRDRFLEAACDGAGLKLHRFKVQASYNLGEVRDTLFPPPPPEQIEPTLVDSSQKKHANGCPKCSKPLVKRVAKSREHRGKVFLACSGFPECGFVRY